MYLSRRGLLAGSASIPLARQARPLNAPRVPAGFGVTGGTRILPAITPLAALSAFTLAAGATKTLYAGPVSGASYVLSMDTLNANGATSALPFTKLSAIWKNGPLGVTVALQHWFMIQTNASPAANNAVITGRGPTESAYLTANIKNEDTGNSVTVDAVLYQSSRMVTRHDLRSVSNNITGSYTGAWVSGLSIPTPVSDPAGLILGASPNLSIGAGLQASRLNALYSGQVQLAVETTPGANVTAALYAVDPDFVTQLQLLYEGTVPASGFLVAQNITAPRMPTVIVLTNNGGASIGASYSLVAQEFAS